MKKILIVEDDSFLQGLTSRKLKSEGFEVIGANNGNLGLDALKTILPDLILLDLLLPGIDGFEFLKNIRSNDVTKNIPVIVFSNLSEDKDIKKAQDLGINDFLIKSNFTLDELVQKAKNLIGQ